MTGKKVSAADRSKEYTFEVTLSDSSFSGSCGTVLTASGSNEKTSALVFTGGKATFTLKDGQKLKIKNIPADLKYTVKEISHDGAEVTMTDAAGTVSTGSAENDWSVSGYIKFRRTVNLAFKNKVPPQPEPEPEKPGSPEKGDALERCGMDACLCAVFVHRAYSHKEQKTSRIKKRDVDRRDKRREIRKGVSAAGHAFSYALL